MVLSCTLTRLCFDSPCRGLSKRERGPLKHKRGPSKHERGPLKHERGQLKHGWGLSKHERGLSEQERGPSKDERGLSKHERGPSLSVEVRVRTVEAQTTLKHNRMSSIVQWVSTVLLITRGRHAGHWTGYDGDGRLHTSECFMSREKGCTCTY